MRITLLLPIMTLLLASCDDAAPEPTFELLFPLVTGDLMSNSSPNLIDLDGDGSLDIVYGTGADRLVPVGTRFQLSTEPEIAGYVTAVSGATNEILWRAPHFGEAFTTPRFADLNGDGVADVVMGGRQGALAAFHGREGTALWQAQAARVAETPVAYNFFTPAFIDDVNGDGVADLVVIYGGDDTRLPNEPRATGYVVVISGADGAVLAVHETPDGSESYSSVIVYERAAGTPWLIFGTGGETQGGAAYRVPVAALLDGSFSARVEQLGSSGTKGVMAPATLVELTGDDELDIVISTFDGRLLVLDGASRATLWERRDENEETYHPAAVMRVSRDGRLGLLLSRAVGTFPRYAGNIHRLLDARDGSLLYQYREPLGPAGAPLAVDLTGDGIDEPIFFGARGRIHILHGPSGELILHDVPFQFAATPHIADPRGTGTLELIGTSWENVQGDVQGLVDWRDMRSQLLRMDLNAAAPEFPSWAAYMGTALDGQYRVADPGARE